MPENWDARVAALKRERAGYLARGEEARAAMVDDELRKYDPTYKPPAKADEPAVDKPAGRATRQQRQSTADAKAGSEG